MTAPEVRYNGFRSPADGRTLVFRQHGCLAAPLPLRLDLRAHSPTGFEWGYHGSGPADLALAVMHALLPPVSEEEEQRHLEAARREDYAGDFEHEALAVQRIGTGAVRGSGKTWALHQDFKRDVIASLSDEGGFVPIEDLRA